MKAIDPSQAMLDARLSEMAVGVGFGLLETAHLPPREARYGAAPHELPEELRTILETTHPRGLYLHQCLALNHLADGNDVCLTTATASGKSLVFMTAAVDLLLRDPTATVVSLYPAKALIQDQLGKWRSFLAPFSMQPGYIDGAVSMDAREKVLETNRVVLMTPDVTHAWMMSHAAQARVRPFMERIRLLILDEAHVYDGVFGTNMAYFIRRFLAATGVQRVIASTATMGEPEKFLERLTGHSFRVIDDRDEGAPSPPKTVLLLRGGDQSFDHTVALIRELAVRGFGRFLAFADSRRMVEQIVAASERPSSGADESDDETGEEDGREADRRVLPYRAGYEEVDRNAIQQALTEGTLAGVVSTSALELGLDIGEIDIVLLLDSPPTVKSFWQRVGRAGRRNPGVCLLVDSRGTVAAETGGLKGYLTRAVEPGWLYLENRYLQYTQALCAAHEVTGLGRSYDRSQLRALPSAFNEMLENELNPVEAVPVDLYQLKQRGQAGPHYEFPVRTGIEKSFVVKERLAVADRPLGNLTFSQLLREAFPGAIYYYMARPYRVTQVNYRAGEVVVTRTKRWTTRPSLQNMVFPRLQGILSGRRSDRGFVVETPLQVSERVVGFTERRGPNRVPHTYGPGSPYAQRPLQRMLDTTGVCWHFDEPRSISLGVGEVVADAFAALCGIEKRDIGVGVFKAKPTSFWPHDAQGACIYDATHGSLRLTQQLGDRFEEVCEFALKVGLGGAPRDSNVAAAITLLADLVREAPRADVMDLWSPGLNVAEVEDVVRIVAQNQPAFLLDDITREVRVIDFRYTPKGAMYQLESDRRDHVWMVPRELVIPIAGVSALEEVNLVTGARRAVGVSE